MKRHSCRHAWDKRLIDSLKPPEALKNVVIVNCALLNLEGEWQIKRKWEGKESKKVEMLREAKILTFPIQSTNKGLVCWHAGFFSDIIFKLYTWLQVWSLQTSVCVIDCCISFLSKVFLSFTDVFGQIYGWRAKLSRGNCYPFGQMRFYQIIKQFLAPVKM